MWEIDYRDAAGVRRRPLFPTEEAAHEEAARVFQRLAQALPASQNGEMSLREYTTRWLATAACEKAPRT